MTSKTHREAKQPSISARYLADYMAASDTRRRSIIRGCKYKPIAKVVQHDQAKSAISHYLVTGAQIDTLMARAHSLRHQMADDDFDRDVLDHNADYIDRFATIYPDLKLPAAEILAPGKPIAIEIAGVRVRMELAFRLRRVVKKTNKVRLGGSMLRYTKGKPLDAETGLWQAALLYGVLEQLAENDNESPEHQLCLTIDAAGGEIYPAPGDSITRFKHMRSALTTISEHWPNIAPPPKAVL
jgi:hypothetical protein